MVMKTEDRAKDEIHADKLTSEQRRNIEALNRHTPEILVAFDTILATHGIDLQVKSFTLTGKTAEREAHPFWACCACPPPEYAPIGQCATCPPPDGGAGPIVVS